MSNEIPKRAMVQVIKPVGPYHEWPNDQQDVGWHDYMDDYVGGTYIVASRNSYDREIYNLEGIPDFVWHRDWLVVLSSEPYDNTGRTKCFWCKEPLKHTKEKSAVGLLKFSYCPKCGR